MLFLYPHQQPTMTSEQLLLLIFGTPVAGFVLYWFVYDFHILYVKCRREYKRIFSEQDPIVPDQLIVVQDQSPYQHISYSNILNKAQDALKGMGLFGRLFGDVHKEMAVLRFEREQKEKEFYACQWRSASEIKEAVRHIEKDTNLAVLHQKTDSKEYDELVRCLAIDSIEDLQRKRKHLMDKLRSKEYLRYALTEDPNQLALTSAGVLAAMSLFEGIKKTVAPSPEALAITFIEVRRKRKEILQLAKSDEERDAINAVFDMEEQKLLE